MRIFLSAILSLFYFTSCSQGKPDKLPIIDTLFHKIGETDVIVTRYKYEPVSDLFIIKLHDNEQTAEEAAKDVLKEFGGVLLVVESNNERSIQFQHQQQLYRFDPNRMFSDSGIVANLKTLNSVSLFAVDEIKGFADFILKQIPDSVIIVAVHNNTNERFSVNDYLPGGSLEKETIASYKNSKEDADDFVLTTDSLLYSHFVKEKVNTALQNSNGVTDDGSLSVYCGKNGRSYLNIEAEHGHVQEQVEMLRTMIAFLRKYREQQ